jgi:hypothetical protein
VTSKTHRLACLGAVAATLLLSSGPASAADFPTVVRNILNHQSDGPLAEMEPDRRAEMTSCVIDTLGALPSGLKRRIVEAGSLEDQEHEFGRVVDDNHAKWRQTIARTCGHIATAQN